MLWIMAKLIYSAIASLDGYVNDAEGKFEWAAPDAEVHAFINDEERPIGTYLYGRRMYEMMAPWETLDDPAPAMRDFAQLWRAADKIVYSRTLDAPTTPRTTLEREFAPEAVRRLKAASERGLSIGGPHLAAEAIRAGLVDECRLYLTPIVIGGGTRALPDDVRWPLVLLDERRFGNGVVFLRYGASTPGRS
jgi:dihydrofolate reductase